MFNIKDVLKIMTYQIEKGYNILYLEIKELMGTGHSILFIIKEIDQK
jgi:hypothetical protein